MEAYCTLAGVSPQLFEEGAALRIQDELTHLSESIEQVEEGALGDDELYQYQVPLLGDGGACSLFGHTDPTPYDLRVILGGSSKERSQALAKLHRLVDLSQQSTGVDWIGVYKRFSREDGSQVLAKLAYRGSLSRAEFPLTEEFAQHSNNSRVGLTGHARIIQDVVSYAAAGGEYYTCDPKVMAEACLPLFHEGNVVGIVDLETAKKDYFNGAALEKSIAFTLMAQEIVSSLAP